VLAPSRIVPYVATAANPCPAKSLVNEITIASAVQNVRLMSWPSSHGDSPGIDGVHGASFCGCGTALGMCLDSVQVGLLICGRRRHRWRDVDWPKATLTDHARHIIREAAANSTQVQYTRTEANAHTDTSGMLRCNQGLLVCLTDAVAAELGRDGVPASAISICGFGHTQPLVPTRSGVREPRTPASRSSFNDSRNYRVCRCDDISCRSFSG